MEVKRELVVGQLADRRAAVLAASALASLLALALLRRRARLHSAGRLPEHPPG